jgi:hypothetical protein
MLDTSWNHTNTPTEIFQVKSGQGLFCIVNKIFDSGTPREVTDEMVREVFGERFVL